MRKILFRGKSRLNVNYLGEDEPLVKKGEWVYGSLILDDVDYHHIHTLTRRGREFVNVEAETIGQFTGLLDCEGRGIYEGDILMVTQGAMEGFRGYVEWRVDFAEWELKSRRSQMAISQHIIKGYGMKIVSNIHDNPKFLEEIK